LQTNCVLTNYLTVVFTVGVSAKNGGHKMATKTAKKQHKHHRGPFGEQSWEDFRAVKLTDEQKAERATYDSNSSKLATNSEEAHNYKKNMGQVADIEKFFGRQLSAHELRALAVAMSLEVTLGLAITGKARPAMEVAKDIFADNHYSSIMKNGNIIAANQH
jgi:hypothetical protein